MKVFISWSGEASQHIGRALLGWLPDVIQAVEPWMSDSSIAKGSRWNLELSRQLEEVDQGIICVTTGNVREPWLNYEAGALAKSLSGQVRPLLFDLEPAEVTGPLASFQTTRLRDKGDMLELTRSLNSALDNPLADDRLVRQFGLCWSRLETDLESVPAAGAADTPRAVDDMVSETLTLVRQLARTAPGPAPATTQLRWQKAVRSEPAGDGIEVASVGDRVALRDSKHAEDGAIFYSKPEFEAFVDGARRGEFDHLL